MNGGAKRVIEPGTEVVVTITGTVKHSGAELTTVRTENGARYMLARRNPDVSIVALEPERPTLDRETILATVREGLGVVLREVYNEDEDVTNAILDLIEAVHPGLVR